MTEPITPLWGLWTLVLATAGLTILAAVLSELLERGGLIRLRHWAESAGRAVQRLYSRPDRFEAFRLALSLLSRLGLVATFLLAQRASGNDWAALVALLLTLLVGEVVGRVLVAKDPEEALNRLTLVYRTALAATRPLMWLLHPLVPQRSLERKIEDGEIDEASEGELEAYLDVGQREGILEPGEEELVKGVVEFGDTLVKGVMTPRTEVDLAPDTTSLDDLLELFMSSGHSRVPLYGDSMDEVTGILHIRDLLEGMRAEEPRGAGDLAMEPFIVPETKPISELLREFQSRRLQLAVVVDEFGGAAGVVTVEDLLEEIVGDIADEHESEDVERISLGAGAWQLAGSCEIEELEDLFDLELDNAPYETVGGLVFTALGYLPEPGERITRHGLDFEVVAVGDRRIRAVRVERSLES